MRKRLSKFHSNVIDKTQYDKDALQKQLNLEIITINLEIDSNDKKDFLLECGGQCTSQVYKRSVTKIKNEEGKFMQLI